MARMKQSVTRTNASANGKKRTQIRAWTKEDYRELKAHSKSKTPVAKISRAMKRTPGALRQQAFHLGSHPPHPPCDPDSYRL
jgi:hypothetical protein